MPVQKDTRIEITCQGYKATSIDFNLEGNKAVIMFISQRQASNYRCKTCGSEVWMNGEFHSNLKDMPIWPNVEHDLCFIGHRYRCSKCGKTFTEEIPLKHPGTRITERAANWIKALLKCNMTVKSIQKMTWIHWDTIREIQKEYIAQELTKQEQQLEAEGYKPRVLAVDEFAIHKGHTYATAVMDLERGNLIWVGKGRAKVDFEKFFQDTREEFLSEVTAVAMDMNASFNMLIQKHLPNAQIVYDRFHMQQQYGKEVLGVVRLAEARKHKAAAKEIQSFSLHTDTAEAKRKLKAQVAEEKANYRTMKRARWTLLMNSTNLSERQSDSLNKILSSHTQLAVCYAMKEEMTRLFSLTDITQAREGWTRWFHAAKKSNIEALTHFAELKEKRLDGLVAHAFYHIGTSKLEGFNNKIKVAKRIGYGYRDDNYFFSLIQFLSIPST